MLTVSFKLVSFFYIYNNEQPATCQWHWQTPKSWTVVSITRKPC